MPAGHGRRQRRRFIRIDILVNNVGSTIWTKPFEFYAEDEIEAESRRSLFPTCGAAAPYRTCRERPGAASSTCPPSPPQESTGVPYGAAKGGECPHRLPGLQTRRARHPVSHRARHRGAAAPSRAMPPNRVSRKRAEQAVYTQSLDSSLMKRYGSLDEQAHAIPVPGLRRSPPTSPAR